MLRTSDGATIGMTYPGLRHGPAETLERLGLGESVTPRVTISASRLGSQHRRPRLRLDQPDPGDWRGHRFPDGPVYSLFEVL